MAELVRPRTRVLVVDDHPIVREGISAAISAQRDLLLVDAVATAEEALAIYARERPDVVLLDLKLPDGDGVEVLKALRARFPRARVVMLSSHEGDDAAHRALKEGALGYVWKRMPTAVFLEALRNAAEGRRTIPPEVAARLGAQAGVPALSAREVEVLACIAQGESNKQIGERLGISASTVKNHINNLLAKLGAADRTQAVTIGLQRGIIAL